MSQQKIWFMTNRIYKKKIKFKFKLTCLLKAAISSLKDSDEQTSAPCIFWSLGVHVANSHFSKTNANRGKSG